MADNNPAGNQAANDMPDSIVPVVPTNLRLHLVQAPFDPPAQQRIELGRVAPVRHVMGNERGDHMQFCEQNNLFLVEVFSYVVHLKHQQRNEPFDTRLTDRQLFLQAVDTVNQNYCRLVRFQYQPLNTRGLRYAATFWNHATALEGQNRVTRGISRYFGRIRLGHIPCRGDEFQAGVQAVKMDFLDRVNDTQSAGSGGWTLFFVRVLNSHLIANGVTGIALGEDADHDIQLQNGPRKDNSTRVRRNGMTIKVESRPAVVNELINFLRVEFDEDINIVEPEDDDEAPAPGLPAVDIRPFDYDT